MLLLFVLFSGHLFAQGCAMCSLNAQSLGDQAGAGLNKGILYLAAIPISFVLTIGSIWYWRNRAIEKKQD